MIYVTEASPQSVTWLAMSDAQEKVSLFASPRDQPARRAMRAQAGRTAARAGETAAAPKGATSKASFHSPLCQSHIKVGNGYALSLRYGHVVEWLPKLRASEVLEIHRWQAE